jgi:hypothetical protein
MFLRTVLSKRSSASLRPRSFPKANRNTFTTTTPKSTSETASSSASSPVDGVMIYDKITLQPLGLTVFSFMTLTSFTVFEITRKETPEDAGAFVKFFTSPWWNVMGISAGAFGLFLSTKYCRFLVSEVISTGNKVYIRTHTMLGRKAEQEVFEITDLTRLKQTSKDYINWKSLSTKRSLVLQYTEEADKFIPYGFTASPVNPNGVSASNLGGTTLTQAKMYEKALKGKWMKKKHHKS